MHDLAGLQLAEPDFIHLRQLCRKDTRFPATWESWQDLMQAAHEDAARHKMLVKPIRISLNDFERWCYRVETVPSLDALRAFLILGRTGACASSA